MCILCVEWQKGNLTPKEAFRNINEMIDTSDNEEDIGHYLEVLEEISVEVMKEFKNAKS